MGAATPWILGLNTAFHNGSACLCHGNELVVAVQEERLNRTKRSRLAPHQKSLAVAYCLQAAGIRLADVELVVNCTIARTPLNVSDVETLLDGQPRHIEQITHHLGHAFSVFCTSGFSNATILVIDGGGSYRWQLSGEEADRAGSTPDYYCEHCSVYSGDPTGIHSVAKYLSDMSYLEAPKRGMPLFRSLGHMFSSVAYQIFGDYFEAGKVMALAPFGRVTVTPEEFAAFSKDRFVFRDNIPLAWCDEVRWPRRRREYEDLAASVQNSLEHNLRDVIASCNGHSQQLCYAGGVALNSVANQKVLRQGGFERLYVIPAAEDSGVAIGAAYYGLGQLTGRVAGMPLRSDSLGRRYTRSEIDDAVHRCPGVTVMPCDDPVGRAAELLCEGQIVGLFHSGSEFGPRALGFRSILADPRRADGKDVLNRRVKHREAFRPFAPAVLAQHAHEWFEMDAPDSLTDCMLDVCRFRPHVSEAQLPAVMHVDRTGRLQTVTQVQNPVLYELIERFHALTGVPMVLNTSMNVMGEPIVETPDDALWVLLFTGIDLCIVERSIVTKKAEWASVLDVVFVRTELGDEVIKQGLPLRASVFSERLYRALTQVDGHASFRQIFKENMALLDADERLCLIVGHMFRCRFVEAV